MPSSKYLVIQCYHRRAKGQPGRYMLMAAEDVGEQTKRNLGDRKLATRAQVPDTLLNTRFRSVKAATDAADEHGLLAYTVQAITAWAKAD